MNEPLAVAIILTKDRPEMAKRAVECFRQQTYQNKRLYIYDTGRTPCTHSLPEGFPDFGIVYHRGLDEGMTLGELRNRANWWGVRATAPSQPDADILIHWDDDDWSQPNRISEQVALLQASGKQVVGYRDMLFWRDTVPPGVCANVERIVAKFPAEALPLPDHLRLRGGEAWLYSSKDPRYCLGTSLCYWRETWEKRPFKAISRGEDKEFLRDRDTLGVSSIVNPTRQNEPGTPRMIASIHSGNHVVYDTSTSEWERVSEWDSYCRERMAL